MITQWPGDDFDVKIKLYNSSISSIQKLFTSMTKENGSIHRIENGSNHLQGTCLKYSSTMSATKIDMNIQMQTNEDLMKAINC